MKVKDLKAKMGNVDIIIDVIDIAEPREFQKFGKPGRVANAIAKDETGDVKLTLWNDDIEKVKAGDKIHITNGYVNEWQGELQLGTGRMGKMEIVGKADASVAKKEEPVASEPEQDISVEEEDIEDLSGDDEEI
ncbi:MAG TPA: SOSS complex subunit B family protein [Candidatus Nanoarchaeia archaeon]|nr:SOSS complex subunit B family protein [Candidatus Nanoarchaeia archaeon]